ncbi:cytochrome c [uncultured Chitinophaga sp.]|jgi:Cytochrome c|uniref:c-type cytochrome n=1 Tax=uncultured Chitinophaga sp. TaxID=339340 RepID=UPI0026183ABA|nr:cytochrome c [uncultured Chitinophaga sp.]
MRLITLTFTCAVFIACNHRTKENGTSPWPASFHIGRPATPAEIAAWDIDIRPDGAGLPPGAGTAASGKPVYMAKCAACHGTGTEPLNAKLPGPALMNDSAGSDFRRLKTLGNYWPYATTIFDYVRRTMPYNAPGTLTADEVYSLTAYLLFANKIIDEETVMDARSLPKVNMPAKHLFIPDNSTGGPEIR